LLDIYGAGIGGSIVNSIIGHSVTKACSN